MTGRSQVGGNHEQESGNGKIKKIDIAYMLYKYVEAIANTYTRSTMENRGCRKTGFQGV